MLPSVHTTYDFSRPPSVNAAIHPPRSPHPDARCGNGPATSPHVGGKPEIPRHLLKDGRPRLPLHRPPPHHQSKERRREIQHRETCTSAKH